jgi:hypothetical protein
MVCFPHGCARENHARPQSHARAALHPRHARDGRHHRRPVSVRADRSSAEQRSAMNLPRRRARRFAWALLATQSIVALHLSCSSEKAKPPSDIVDASADTSFDADDPDGASFDAVAVDSRDGDFIPCTSGEEPQPCAAVLTGCPSFTVCSERFGLRCPCRTCMLTLQPGVCSWTLMVDNPRMNFVDRIGIDGGSQRLQEIAPGPCADEPGFIVERVPGVTTVTLCPASCREHELDPSVTFTLGRGTCPIP